MACSGCSRRDVETQLGRRAAPAPLLSSPLPSSPLHLPLTLPTAPPRRLPDPASPGAAPWAVPCRGGSDRSGAAPGGGRSSAAPARSPRRGRSRLARSPPGAALVHPPSSFCGLAAPHDRPQVSERRSPGPRGEAAAPEGAREARGLPPGPRRLSTPRPPFRGVRG